MSRSALLLARRSFARLALGFAAMGAIAAFTPFASAQGEAKFEWQKRTAAISFGVPRVGKHTLDELKVGDTWRCGANGVTTLSTDAPLIADDLVVAPGVYRVNVARQEKEKFELTIEGAGRWTAAGGDDVHLPAKFELEKKLNDKLEIATAATKQQDDAELRALETTIQFGAPRLTLATTIVGTQPMHAAKGFAIDAFKLPEKWLAKRLELAKQAPVATLTRQGKAPEGAPERLNLLLTEKDALIVPALTPPTENHGFGAIPWPAPEWTLHGTVTWSDAAKPSDHLHAESAEVDKDELHFVATVGKRTADVKVPLVPSKKSKPTPTPAPPTKN